MQTLSGKKILLGITGGIAAYKSLFLLRELKRLGAQIEIVLTQSAEKFVTPLSCSTLNGKNVYRNEDEAENAALSHTMPHIALAKWADLILIAPASANFIAKLAHGFADDLLSALCLASPARLFFAPAMNQQMWQSAGTQHNLQILLQRGAIQIGPAVGEQACGDFGLGRMQEPEEIIQSLNTFYTKKEGSTLKQGYFLQDYTILITAGPTREPIDPVRYLSNYSSGKMGYALAKVAQAQGAKVLLVSGPTSLTSPEGVTCFSVETAKEMYDKVSDLLQTHKVDIFVGAAAVADYRALDIAPQKIKKQESEEKINTLSLIKNPDIVHFVAHQKNKPFVVAFAGETESLLENARLKMIRKKADLLIANVIHRDGLGLETEDNQVSVLDETGQLIWESERALKIQLAHSLWEIILSQFIKKREVYASSHSVENS